MQAGGIKHEPNNHAPGITCSAMVAVSVGEKMPTRTYSPLIVGGLWPRTSISAWSGAAQAQRTFATASTSRANAIRSSAYGLLTDNSGEMIESMHVAFVDDGRQVQTQGDLYKVMADAVDACAKIVQDARSLLDAIDADAHEAIQQALDNWKGGSWFGPLALVYQIWGIISRARSHAEAASEAMAAAVGAQLTVVSGAATA